MLRAEALKVGYGQRVVVDGGDMHVAKGQFIGLLGPNGCGKSTLIRTIVRMLNPLGGIVYLGGRQLSQLHQHQLARQLSVVLTDRPATGMLTTFEVASMGRYPHTGFFGRLGEDDISKTWASLRQVGADSLADRYFSELSDGEKQKVLIARALTQDPELIVLDEPTSHLDTHHRIEVLLILRRLVREKGVTIVASMHDVDLALKACDAVILVRDGRVLASGPPEDVLDEANVALLYGLARARFSTLLGGVELRAGESNSVFVVAGAGTGGPVYRVLVKHGLGFATGLLAANDIDTHVAHSMGARVIGPPAYESPSQETLAEARQAIATADHVVDAGFPVGSHNTDNVALLLAALSDGKAVHSLRPAAEARALYGELACRAAAHASLAQLIEAVRHGAVRQALAPLPA